MKARFDELLPFYVNGTLDAEARAFVDAWLREHPEAASELHWLESLQARVREQESAASNEVGLERALARIRRDGPAPRVAAPAAPVARGSAWERLRDALTRLVPQPMLAPALVGALALVVVQAGLIGALVGERGEWSDWRALRGAAPAERGPWLKINFKPDAREADIRLLLVEVHASLAAGPGQLGDWFVRVEPSRLDAAKAHLEASAIVDAVAIVDALPAPP
jgi:hypothetical protein